MLLRSPGAGQEGLLETGSPNFGAFIVDGLKNSTTTLPPNTTSITSPLLLILESNDPNITKELSTIAAGLYEAPVTTLDISRKPRLAKGRLAQFIGNLLVKPDQEINKDLLADSGSRSIIAIGSTACNLALSIAGQNADKIHGIGLINPDLQIASSHSETLTELADNPDSVVSVSIQGSNPENEAFVADLYYEMFPDAAYTFQQNPNEDRRKTVALQLIHIIHDLTASDDPILPRDPGYPLFEKSLDPNQLNLKKSINGIKSELKLLAKSYAKRAIPSLFKIDW